jgi:hypothetical protein
LPRRHIHIETIEMLPAFATHEGLQAGLAALLAEWRSTLKDPREIVTMGSDAIKGMKLDVRTAHARNREPGFWTFTLGSYRRVGRRSSTTSARR